MAAKTLRQDAAISRDGAIANCQRRLAFKGQQLRSLRGRIYLIDVESQEVLQEIHDLEAFAKKLGALSPWKTIKVPQTV